MSLDLMIRGCSVVIQSNKETPENLAIAFYNRSVAYADQGQSDRAIEDYTQAIQINPDYSTAFTNRGNAYAAKGQYDRAIEDYDEAIRLNPNYAKAFDNRGAAYHDKSQHDRAVAAITTRPSRSIRSNAAALDIPRRAYDDKRQQTAPLTDYNEALRLDPRTAAALKDRCGYC